MSIAAPNRVHGKLTEFYPLQKNELLKLYDMGLIKSAAYVYFALRLENPFCDRPIEIIVKKFAFRWRIPEKSVYRAIARLKELEILDIKSGKLFVTWVEPKPEPEDNTNDSDNPKSENGFSEVRIDSQSCEKILKSENGFSEVRIDSQSCENQPPQPPPDKDHRSPQTLQTYSDFKDSLSESERKNFFNFVRRKTENLEKPINDLEAWLASKNAAKQNRWEIYYKNYQEEKISQSARNNKQNPGSGKYSPSEVQQAIAEFQNRHKKREQERKQIKEQERLKNAENNLNNQKNE